ncbi:hypothetical protein NPIL_385221 [Nephila pilipes]|uniref:Uncharacterized protein n=1 Tax=Nephila pilipes TaxID=299642 RepID=A0A8X6UF02_NEPPI|nr:hypothetical protein NPIL_385221 [Nephila pilipes]
MEAFCVSLSTACLLIAIEMGRKPDLLEEKLIHDRVILHGGIAADSRNGSSSEKIARKAGSRFFSAVFVDAKCQDDVLLSHDCENSFWLSSHRIWHFE